jgi:hypothetical protein
MSCFQFKVECAAASYSISSFLQKLASFLQVSCTLMLLVERPFVLDSGVETNLAINLNKMETIPFTRKREIKGPKEPVLFNKMIQLSSEVK